MASVSLTKGAELAGVSKGTVSKAIKSGKLSYAEKTANGYLIDTSELFRVFPPKTVSETKETGAGSRLETPSGNTGNAANTIALEREIELLREQLEDRDRTVQDLRQRLDKSDEERRAAQERVMGLLSGPTETEAPRGFLSRIFRN